MSLGGSLALFQLRSAAFAAQPTVPLQRVADQYARRFDRLSALLDDAPASVLLPDIPGMLLASHVRVYDLAGLIDRTVARTLQQGNLAGFHDYIFDDARPTFIYVRQWTTAQTRLAEDPRFARDYAPICEYSDPWVAEHLGEAMLSGEYVRREAIAGREGDLLALLGEEACLDRPAGGVTDAGSG